MKSYAAAAVAVLATGASSFVAVSQQQTRQVELGHSLERSDARSPSERLSPLFMGRAAAVRAATKGKTDAKKAKVNAYYGKKIIMAVKQGGSPDPVANRQLAELIKAAKNNSVPVDVS